jgi:hypothetical protein
MKRLLSIQNKLRLRKNKIKRISFKLKYLIEKEMKLHKREKIEKLKLKI